MKKFTNFIVEAKAMKWKGGSPSGWWLDDKIVTLYHGTHIDNVDAIMRDGLRSSSSGKDAGQISLTPDAGTAFGYAAMSGSGGEAFFSKGSKRPKVTPAFERAVLVIKMSAKEVEKRMAPGTAMSASTKHRLTNKDLWNEWTGQTAMYYAMTELQMKSVESKFIKGWMQR